MRLLFLPVLALPLLAAACSSTSQNAATPHYRTGTIVTKWGELPTYSPTPQPVAIRLERPSPDLSGEAVVDMLLDRDGRVKDWNVVSSADNNAFQRGLGVWMKGFRIGPRLAASEPEQHVLRVTFAFMDPGMSRDQYHQTRGQTGPW